MNCWWVNHKQTFRQETGGNYIWSPTVNKNGNRNAFYDNMVRVRVGDLVISYANTAIRALGVAIGTAALVPRPEEFGKAGEAWKTYGWKVPVKFTFLEKPVHPSAHMDLLGPTLPRKYSPIQDNGSGNQGAYLSEVNSAMLAAVKQLLGTEWNVIESKDFEVPLTALDSEDDALSSQIEQRTDIGPTARAQLISARRGQGVYRKNLEALETGCKVTGITNSRHLRASHMKPWRASTDFEKLDGNNGLLLSPHLDHLFDQGFVSFEDNGRLLLSPDLPDCVVAAWHVPVGQNCGIFRREQLPYLAFHRRFIFVNGREST
jgi:hypothetical protein